MFNDGLAVRRCECWPTTVQVLLGNLILVGERLSIWMLGDEPRLWVSLLGDEPRLEEPRLDEPQLDELRISPDGAPLDE